MRPTVLLTLGLVSSVTAGCDQSPPPSRTAQTPTRTQAAPPTARPSTSSSSVPTTPPTGHPGPSPNAPVWTPPPPARTFRTREELRAALVEAGMPTLADSIFSIALPCARLTLTESPDDAIPVGASKHGGQPDLPASLPPDTRAAIASLDFVAQLNFAELAPCLKDDPIWPADGLLSIFLDPANSSPRTPLPNPTDTIRLVYTPAAATLSRASHSTPRRKPNDPAIVIRRITPSIAYSIPDLESKLWEGIQLPNDAIHKFWDRNFRYLETPKHIFGGYAIPEQYEPCYGISRDFQMIRAGHTPSVDNPFDREAVRKHKDIEERVCTDKSEWRLILQFDLYANEDLGCCFNGVMFFIAASPKSIKDRSFSEAWYSWDQD